MPFQYRVRNIQGLVSTVKMDDDNDDDVGAGLESIISFSEVFR